MQGILVSLPLDNKFPVEDFVLILFVFCVFFFFSGLPFLLPTLLKKSHFFQRLLEPGDIEVVHKHPNSVTRSLGQELMSKLP